VLEDGRLARELERRPGDPFWRGAAPCTRGGLLAGARELARQLGRRGWRPGQRLGLLADSLPETATLLLAARMAALDLLLLPLREPADTVARLARAAGCAAWVGGAAAPLPAVLVNPPPPRGPAFAEGGRLWLRSSGSLGQPRWVLHGEASLQASARAVAERLDFGPGALWELSLPLDHAGGLALLLRAICGGGALGPAGCAGASHLSLVPVQLRRRLPDAPRLRRLSVLLLGGGVLDPWLRREALEAGLPLAVSYGLSESAALAAVAGPRRDGECLAEAGFAGRELFAGSLAVDGAGVIHIGGPALCLALAREDGLALPPALCDGRMPTGDLGRLEDDGRLFVDGRRDLVIISGGEKLPAEELEQALRSLPGVLEAVVVPLPDEEWGQRPAAFLRLAGAQLPGIAALREALAGRLASWKHPVAVWTLPDSAALKPDRAALRHLALQLAKGGRQPGVAGDAEPS
jgi:o-succinylbenzoate---CoA ligase